LRKSFHAEPVALAVVKQKFEGGARAVTEDVDGALKRVVSEPLPAHGTEAIDACAEIYRCGGQKDAALRGELQHERTSRKARTNASSGSVEAGAWMHSRVPSARCNSTWVLREGLNLGEALGTSTKPRGREGTAVVGS